MAMNQGGVKRKLDATGIDVKQDDERRDRCYKCGGRGHMQKECNSDPKAGSEQSCYKCQGKGHFARNCPNLSRDVCYFCGQMGHHGLDCPMITRMFGNLPPIKRKELMSRMHQNPQFANLVMREANTMSAAAYGADYANLFAGSNPLQALMALLQSQGGLAGLAGGQTMYSNPYNPQPQAGAASAYPGYDGTPASYEDLLAAAASQGAAASYASAYGLPSAAAAAADSSSQGASSSQSSSASTYSAAPSMYPGAAAANPFAGGADVLSSLRALASSYGGAFGTGYGFGMGLPPQGGGGGGANNCYKCGQAGHFARECTNAPEGAVLCYRCGQSGHMAKECTNPPSSVAGAFGGGGAPGGANESCFRCGERGHFSRDCVKNGAVASKDSCFRCGQPGHRTRECTGQDIRVCFVCKQPGHVSSACPERTAR